MPRITIVLGLVAALLSAKAAEALPQFTTQFPIDECQFSIFGGPSHFSLNPGRQLILRGEELGDEKEMTITVLDETKVITLPVEGGTRRIVTRVVEERERVKGELSEVGRFWYARCIRSGDVYYFGEEADYYENGASTGTVRVWEAGINGTLPGIIMPHTFLLGSRYAQSRRSEAVSDLAENTRQGLTVTTPIGTFDGCVEITEYDGFRFGPPTAIKVYAPGVGIVDDHALLQLEEFNLGTTGLPRNGSFSPFSSNPFFPFTPGRQLVLRGVENGRETMLTITVLNEIQEIPVGGVGEPRIIQARVIEERKTVNAQLAETVRQLVAQCVETGDV